MKDWVSKPLILYRSAPKNRAGCDLLSTFAWTRHSTSRRFGLQIREKKKIMRQIVAFFEADGIDKNTNRTTRNPDVKEKLHNSSCTLVRLCTNSLNRHEQTVNQGARTLLTNLFKCSMNTCKLTSSVKIACPAAAPPVDPYIVADIWVVDGFSFDSKNRAWLPPWSQTM